MSASARVSSRLARRMSSFALSVVFACPHENPLQHAVPFWLVQTFVVQQRIIKSSQRCAVSSCVELIMRHMRTRSVLQEHCTTQVVRM